MLLPGRHGEDPNAANDYRYSFQGQEHDDEVAGRGNNLHAEFWQYDTRLGRRWNIDPVIKIHESPYAAFANNPIWFIDPNGADSTKSMGIIFWEIEPGDTYWEISQRTGVSVEDLEEWNSTVGRLELHKHVGHKLALNGAGTLAEMWREQNSNVPIGDAINDPYFYVWGIDTDSEVVLEFGEFELSAAAKAQFQGEIMLAWLQGINEGFNQPMLEVWEAEAGAGIAKLLIMAAKKSPQIAAQLRKLVKNPKAGTKKGIELIRETLKVGKNRNIAYVEGEVAGKEYFEIGVSGKHNYPGAVKATSNPVFKTTRALDSEAKLLENFARQHKNNTNVEATIRLVSERPYCSSCQGVIKQFQARFPNVTIQQVSGAK